MRTSKGTIFLALVVGIRATYDNNNHGRCLQGSAKAAIAYCSSLLGDSVSQLTPRHNHVRTLLVFTRQADIAWENYQRIDEGFFKTSVVQSIQTAVTTDLATTTVPTAAKKDVYPRGNLRIVPAVASTPVASIPNCVTHAASYAISSLLRGCSCLTSMAAPTVITVYSTSIKIVTSTVLQPPAAHARSTRSPLTISSYRPLPAARCTSPTSLRASPSS